MIKTKRVYDDKSGDDGYRILVDRIWPRGISKEDAGHDGWLKDVAPSDELRKWFGHDEKKWDEFKEKYFDELREKDEQVEKIREAEKEHDTVTLLYAAKDTGHNNAIALMEFLENKQ